MIPDWIVHILQGMGGVGAVIFALATALGMSIGANVQQWRHSNRVYSYRLAERDTLKDALNNAGKVIQEVLEDAETRNDLGEELADLLAKQAAAMELMRQHIGHQFGNLQSAHSSQLDNGKNVASAVSAMADAIRQLHALVMENRVTWSEHVNSIRSQIQTAADAVKGQVAASEANIRNDMRQLIGSESTIVVRRRVTNTRPAKRPSK